MKYTGFIAYKLKAIPEDFQVREQVSELFKIYQNGNHPYAVFRLKKSGWNTVDLLDMIARKNGIRYASFSYGGKKDRHAITDQLVTIRISESGNEIIKNLKSADPLTIKEDKWSFEHIGFSDRAFGPDCIAGNEFFITLRSLNENELPILLNNLKYIQNHGIPNYFDEQRFGGYDPALGFTAAHILNKNYEKALYSYLTFVHSGDKGHAKRRKYSIRDAWGDWDKCLMLSSTAREKKIFSSLRKTMASSLMRSDRIAREESSDCCSEEVFKRLLNYISKEDLSMYFSSLQSWIWNEMLSMQILNESLKRGSEPARIKLGFSDLLFDTESADGFLENIMDFDVPGPGVRYDPGIMHIYLESIKKAGISELYDPGFKAAYLKSFRRKTVLRPQNLHISEVANDDYFEKGRKKISVNFLIGPGSYATMVVKRLTLRV